jgi:hypothetical protein
MAGSSSGTIGAAVGALFTGAATLGGITLQNKRQGDEERQREVKRIKSIYENAIDYINDDLRLRARPPRRHINPSERRRQREAHEKHIQRGERIETRLQMEDNEEISNLFSTYLVEHSQTIANDFKCAVKVEYKIIREGTAKARRNRRIKIIVAVSAVIAITFAIYSAWAEPRHWWPFTANSNKPATSSSQHSSHVGGDIVPALDKGSKASQNHARKVKPEAAGDQQASTDELGLAAHSCAACLGNRGTVATDLSSGVRETLHGVQTVTSGLTEGAGLWPTLDGVHSATGGLAKVTQGVAHGVLLLPSRLPSGAAGLLNHLSGR